MTDGCLDDETLAAYVDGGLTAEERARVQRHLASCQDCFAVFTETVKTVQAMQDEGVVDASAPARIEPLREAASVAPLTTAPKRRVVSWVAAGAGLATAAALVFAVWWPKAERPELVDLVAAVGERRPVEGRLTGGFKFGPIESPTRGAEASTDWRVLAAAGKLEEEARGTEDARLLGALGTAHLVTRDFDTAVKYLDQAIDLAPDDALLRTDRAAALLARGDTEDRAKDFVRALDDAARAVAKNASLPEAQFNRAVALERMHLEDQALDAWKAYLALDSTSSWAAEARTHIAAIERERSKRGSSRSLEPAGEPAGVFEQADAGALAERVATYPVPARNYLEDVVLPQWAAAYLQGDTNRATELRAMAGVIGSLIAKQGDDAFHRDILSALASADPHQLHGTAYGLQLYGSARAMQRADDVATAATEFARAKFALASAGNPFALLAGYHETSAALNAGARESVLRSLEPIEHEARTKGYRCLLGLVLLREALVSGTDGSFSDGLRLYAQSLDALRQSGALEHVANVHSLIAEDLRLIGAYDEAWQHHVAALRLLTPGSSPRIAHQVLAQSAQTGLESGLIDASLVFSQCVIENARRWKHPANTGLGFLHRARARRALGLTSGAESDVAAAATLIESVPDDRFRQRFRTEVAVVESEVLRDSDPRRSERAATEALALLASRQDAVRTPALLFRRGAVRWKEHRTDEAEVDLLRGLAELERQRRLLPAGSLQASQLARHFDGVKALVRFQIDVRNDPSAALRYADGSRARWLVDRAEIDRFAPSTVAEALPRDAVMVYFALADHEVLVWTLRRTGVKLHRLRATDADVNRLMRPFGTLVRTGGDDLSRWLEAAYDLLLRPIEADWKGAPKLIVVPDGPLHEVPFAALRERTSKRYVVEDHEIVYTPSLTAYVRWARRPNPEALPEKARALVFVPGSGPASLPDARREAALVAELYGTSRVEAASKLDFLTGAGTADIVHFSGHAIVNAAMPALSRLVFSQDPKDSGADLYAHELGSVRLRRTKLLVLGACETASGQLMVGEGALTFAHAFHATGVPVVIASQWTIADWSSAEILIELHKRLKGGSPPQALRAAQLSALRSQDPRLRAVAAWGAFRLSIAG